MRVTSALLLLLAFVASAHAATPFRVAILDDDLPGLELSLVAHIRHSLQRDGYTAATLNAIQLADASVLARDRYDVLMLLHSPSFPVRHPEMWRLFSRPVAISFCSADLPIPGRLPASTVRGRAASSSTPFCAGSRKGCRCSTRTPLTRRNGIAPPTVLITPPG